MSELIYTEHGWISADELEQGCQLRVRHYIDVTDVRGHTVGRLVDTMWYGRYTGVGVCSTPPQRRDIRLFENGLWRWDGGKWCKLDDCDISVVPPIYFNDEIITVWQNEEPDTDIPFCDFSNILEEATA